MSESARHLPPEALDDWVVELETLLGLESGAVQTVLVLDLAKEVAVNVARPAAPVSAFAAGLAIGRMTSGDARDVVERIVHASRLHAAPRQE